MYNFINYLIENNKKYFRGKYTTYNRAVTYGNKDYTKYKSQIIPYANYKKHNLQHTYIVCDSNGNIIKTL